MAKQNYKIKFDWVHGFIYVGEYKNNYISQNIYTPVHNCLYSALCLHYLFKSVSAIHIYLLSICHFHTNAIAILSYCIRVI